MNKLYAFFGGRKTTFAILLLIVSIVFIFLGKMTTDEWVDFIEWIFVIYAGGNVGEHISKAFTKK